jgi:hypothetical protein
VAKIEIKEALKQVAAVMQKKLDSYKQEMVELRKKELAKSGEDLCMVCGNPDKPGFCVCVSLNKSENTFTILKKNAVAGYPQPMAQSEKCLMCKQDSAMCKCMEKAALKYGEKKKDMLPGGKKPEDITPSKQGSGGEVKKGMKKAGMAETPKAPGHGSPTIKAPAVVKDLTWDPASKPSGPLKSPWETPPPIPADAKAKPKGVKKSEAWERSPLRKALPGKEGVAQASASAGKLMDNMLASGPLKAGQPLTLTPVMSSPTKPVTARSDVGGGSVKPMVGKGRVQTLVERAAAKMGGGGVDHLGKLPKAALPQPPAPSPRVSGGLPAPSQQKDFGSKKAAVASPGKE